MFHRVRLIGFAPFFLLYIYNIYTYINLFGTFKNLKMFIENPFGFTIEHVVLFQVFTGCYLINIKKQTGKYVGKFNFIVFNKISTIHI